MQGRSEVSSFASRKNSPQSRHQSRLVLAREFMLPQAQHAPSGRPQRPAHQLIPCFVSRELPPPERRVVARLRRVQRTTMPETTIHKDGHAQPGENKIRTDSEGRDIALRCLRRVQRRNSHRTVPALHGPGTPQRGIPTSQPNLHMPPPPRDALRTKDAYQRQLRVFVPAGPDAGHHIATLGFAEDIGHAILLTWMDADAHGFRRRLPALLKNGVPGSALIEPESRNGIHRSKRRKQREKNLGRRRPGSKSLTQYVASPCHFVPFVCFCKMNFGVRVESTAALAAPLSFQIPVTFSRSPAISL